jgi:hypothetical protein
MVHDADRSNRRQSLGTELSARIFFMHLTKAPLHKSDHNKTDIIISSK